MVAHHGQSDCRIFLDQPIRARIFIALLIDSLFTNYAIYCYAILQPLERLINNESFHEEKCTTFIKPFEILNL